MKRTIRDYYEQLLTNKLDNLKETENFLETYNLARLNHEYKESLNRAMTIKEIQSVN